MRNIISEELLRANINHIYSEYETEHKLFIYVNKTDREQAENIIATFANLEKKVPSCTTYSVKGWTVNIKNR